MSKATERVKQIARAFDWRDLLFVGGFTLIYVGGSQISQPWTFVALGAVAVFIALRKGSVS